MHLWVFTHSLISYQSTHTSGIALVVKPTFCATGNSARSFRRRSTDIFRGTMSTANTDSEGIQKNVVVDPFCFRQFREHAVDGYIGTILDISIAKFEDIVNDRYKEEHLKDGYAPFCKHLFIVNDLVDVDVNVLRITPENEGLLRTKYEARTEKELPVLVRYFPKELVLTGSLQLPKAKFLDLILYSREQIRLENAAQQTNTNNNDTNELAPWGIVSIKAQVINVELPMNPITNMRNALGKEQGGSGVALDRASYMEAVNYWKDHAVVS